MFDPGGSKGSSLALEPSSILAATKSGSDPTARSHILADFPDTRGVSPSSRDVARDAMDVFDAPQTKRAARVVWSWPPQLSRFSTVDQALSDPFPRGESTSGVRGSCAESNCFCPMLAADPVRPGGLHEVLESRRGTRTSVRRSKSPNRIHPCWTELRPRRCPCYWSGSARVP